MAYTRALSTNNYGVARLIVATSVASGGSGIANGTHSTLTSAMADAVSGDTIFLRDSVTENVNLTAGVNIAAWQGGTLNTPTIAGKISMTTAGTCNISGIRLASSGAEFLSVTGSAASIVNLTNCYLTTAFDPGITFSSTSASAAININNCQGNISAAATKFYAHSSAGTLNIYNSLIANSGNSISQSSNSAGTTLIFSSDLFFPLINSSTNILRINNSKVECSNINVTGITAGGTGSLVNSTISSGTATAISISGSFTVSCSNVASNNSPTISGAGILNYCAIANSGVSGNSAITTTTQNPFYANIGKYKAAGQPAFLAHVNTLIPNVSGDGTVYTIIFDTEDFDQGSDFNLATSTFTAPVTGKYHFDYQCRIIGGTSITQANIALVTTARTYSRAMNAAINAAQTTCEGSISVTVDMIAGNTATVTVTTTDTGGKIDDVSGLGGGGANELRNYFSGYLAC